MLTPRKTEQITRRIRQDAARPALVDGLRPPIIFPEKHAQLFTRGPTFKTLRGGRGTAKTTSAARYIILRMNAGHVRVACLRRFQTSIRQSIKHALERAIRELGLSHRFDIGKWDITNRVTGSEAFFTGIERNTDDVARGLDDVDIFCIDEAHNVPLSAFEIILPTVRKIGAELLVIWNPRDSEDAPDKLFLPGGRYASESLNIFAEIADNPGFFLSPMAKQMQTLRASDNDLYRHIWCGAYDNKRGTRIFDIKKEIVPREIIGATKPVYGMDWGYVDDPCAVVKVYVIHDHSIVYVQKEAVGYGVELDDMPELLRSVLESEDDEVVSDTSEQRSMADLNKKGFNLVKAEKGPGSITAGIRFLNSFRLIVHPECEETINEARLMRWKVDKKTGKRQPIPVDGNDHCWDAIRYATHRGGIIEEASTFRLAGF